MKAYRLATTSLVTDQELSNPAFIRDVRNFAASLPLRKSNMLDSVLDLFARSDAQIVGNDGLPTRLNYDCLLPSDTEIDQDRAEAVGARVQNWLEETFAFPVPNHIRPRVRVEARERFRVVATMLRAAYPRESMMWGIRAANDNAPDIPPEPI